MTTKNRIDFFTDALSLAYHLGRLWAEGLPGDKRGTVDKLLGDISNIIRVAAKIESNFTH